MIIFQKGPKPFSKKRKEESFYGVYTSKAGRVKNRQEAPQAGQTNDFYTPASKDHDDYSRVAIKRDIVKINLEFRENAERTRSSD